MGYLLGCEAKPQNRPQPIQAGDELPGKGDRLLLRRAPYSNTAAAQRSVLYLRLRAAACVLNISGLL
jgi:hypothetical protein